MRILIAHSFYRVAGGEDQYVRQQVELLNKEHTVELLAAHNEDLDNRFRAAHRMIGSRSRRTEIERTIAAFQPDLIHLHNVYPSLGPSVHQANRAFRKPLVMTVHNYRLRCPNGLMFTEGEVCRRCLRGNTLNAVVHKCFPSRAQAAAYASATWVHRFIMRLERDVSLFICPSEFVQKTLTEWGVPSSKTRVVRNFTTTGPSDHRPGDYGLYLGRLSPEKGIDVLMRALAIAGDPQFRIVGDGPAEQDLRSLATQLKLNNTRFVGRASRESVAGLLDNARFLAMPSVWHENAPLATLEAMIHGVPLLVSDMGGLPELARDGRGIICPPGDIAALASGIESLMGPGDKRSLYGERARAFALENVTPEAHKAALRSAYAGLLEVALPSDEAPNE